MEEKLLNTVKDTNVSFFLTRAYAQLMVFFSSLHKSDHPSPLNSLGH